MFTTPVLFCSIEQLNLNIQQMQQHCSKHELSLRPMLKTHKCAEIIRMQLEAGAIGILAASLKEAVLAFSAGCKDITLAYPFLDPAKDRILQELSETCTLTMTVDCLEQVDFLATCFLGLGPIKVLIKIDSGLHRLGILPEDVPRLRSVCKAILHCKSLEYAGVSTHAGQVYACRNREEVQQIAEQEQNAVRKASDNLRKLSPSNVIAIGSTPTVISSNSFEGINEVRPGNYVFYDRIQMSLGIAQQEQCALRVGATVLSKPDPLRAIINAGSKQLGLDRGAHGQELLNSYGLIVNHPGATLYALSEELGRISLLENDDQIKVGECLQIIPNHACVTANLFKHLHLTDSKGRVIDRWSLDSGT